MSLSDMQVFEQYAYGSATETVAQQVELFNDASGGVITLVAGQNEGDYSSETFWQEISGLVRRRNAYGSGAVSSVALTQDAMTSVKVAGGSAPVAFEPQQLSWIRKNPEEAGVVIGEQIGVGITQDYINTAISCGVAAVSGQTALVQDGTAATITRAGLNLAAARFGDRSAQIATWITHSKTMHDLFGENITNATRLFSIGDISIVEDGFGRRLIMTDSPALLLSGSPDTYRTLGLTAGAISVEDNGDFFSNIDTSNGNENIQRTYQAEYTFNVKVKGYTWDKAAGGASPTDAALAAPANWDKVVTSDKNTAGVMLNTQ